MFVSIKWRALGRICHHWLTDISITRTIRKRRNFRYKVCYIALSNFI